MEFKKGDKVLVEATVLVADKYGWKCKVKSEDTDFWADMDMMRPLDGGRDITAYRIGMNDSWKAAEKICSCSGFSPEELEEIFDTHNITSIFRDFSASEAVAKIAEWEELQKPQEEEIQVGEIVQSIAGCRCVVTKAGEEECSVVFDDGSAGKLPRRALTKTGRQIDITSWLRQIGGDE